MKKMKRLSDPYAEEMEKLIKIMKGHLKEIKAKKKIPREMLICAGILTKKGTIKKKYSKLCIALDQVSY